MSDYCKANRETKLSDIRPLENQMKTKRADIILFKTQTNETFWRHNIEKTTETKTVWRQTNFKTYGNQLSDVRLLKYVGKPHSLTPDYWKTKGNRSFRTSAYWTI